MEKDIINLTPYIAIRMYIILILVVFPSQLWAQIYLGFNQKEGIIIDELSVISESQLEHEQIFLSRFSGDLYGRNIVFDEFKSEFADLTNVKIGDTFYVACECNTTMETVSGYLIFDYFYSREFGPLISNKTAFCSFENFEDDEFRKNLVLVSKSPIRNTLSFSSLVPFSMFDRIMSRLLKDVKHFEIGKYDYGADSLLSSSNEYISEIRMQDLRVFRGSFCNKYAQEYFVSYSRQTFDDFVNVNCIMDTLANVIEYFTTPRIVFEYREVIGVCDYDNDGIHEFLMKAAYFEGEGYEYWKFTGKSFEKITEGFYIGS